MAVGDGVGGIGLSSCRWFSMQRNVRIDEPDATRGSGRPFKYRGRALEGRAKRVFVSHINCARIVCGVANPNRDRGPPQLSRTSANDRDPGTVHLLEQTTVRTS